MVLGDLNESQERDRAALAPLRAAFAEVDPAGRLATSPNDPGDQVAVPRDKIDYVFFRGLTSTAPPSVPWVPGSDHRPVIGAVRPR